MIRDARPSDITAIVELWQTCGLHVEPEPEPASAEHELHALLQSTPDLMLVDERDGVIAGTVLGTWDGRRGWLQRVATHPEQRGLGIATALVAEVETRLRARGCRKVNLLIERDNAAVQPFYERLAFARDDLIFMEKWL